MLLNDYYSSRIAVFQKTYATLQKKENNLSMIRLALFLGSLVIFYFLFSISVVLSVVMLLTGLFSLGWVVQYQNKIIRKKEFNENLRNINELEKVSLTGDIHAFPDGTDYMDKEHPYSYDLDIFGKASLFQFVNRTISKPGSDLLSQWLLIPAPLNEIYLRQKAVTELKDLTEWRHQMMAIAYQYKDAAKNPRIILDWLTGKFEILDKKFLRLLTIFLSVISVGTAVMTLMGWPSVYLVMSLIFNSYVYYRYIKKINLLHRQVSKSYDLLQSYGDAIRLIECQTFESEKLSQLKSAFLGGRTASQQIKILSKLVNRLDTRLNIMVSVPLNVFFFWDIHYCFSLEKWKLKNAALLPLWFSAMAEIEALSSLSNVSFNHPDWVLPKVSGDYFNFSAVNMGHPLIPGDRRICNDFNIAGSSKIVLVTGSNMSGKSTFQRTCGVNMVLALAGAAVCAGKFEISHVNLITSMRISDSLEDNTSSFYAELKRLAMIIREVEHDPHVFLLLDEILRGTNSNDRHIGTIALMKQLIQQNSTAILATHDLSLSALEGELPGKIDMYNFDVKINGEELYFDYKLNRGVCKSLNASILMKKMGIKV